MLITADTKIRDALTAHPELKQVLIDLNPRYERLNHGVVFQTVGRFARMSDVARVGKMSLCALLHALNAALDQEDALVRAFPDCVNDEASHTPMTEHTSPPRESPFKIAAASTAGGAVSPWLDPARPRPAWYARRDGLDELDVRGMPVDPFERIMAHAQDVQPGHGFTLVQTFLPTPIINMLGGMGFEVEVEPMAPDLFYIHVFLPASRAHGTVPGEAGETAADERVGVVFQSATPVVWPVLMRLMQSERLRQRVRFDQVKVWDRTEKHMGWLVKGKADVTFSAVVAATRLFANGLDIRLASVDVWDNFHLLTRAPHPRRLADLGDRTLRLPLVKNAPPFAITSYLAKREGVDPTTLRVDFGKPAFAPPEEIKDAFLRGEHDAVLLREPEASYALHGASEQAGREAAVLSYRELWRAHHPGEGDLPNAGLVFKGSFLREHPEEARLIVHELRAAIAWVNAHRQEAAALSWDIMGHSQEEVRLFLDRVHFEHRSGAGLRPILRHYLDVLVNEGGLALPGTVDDALRFLVDVDVDADAGAA